MRVAIVAVGRVKERAMRAVLDEYLGRIRRYTKLDEVELRDAPKDELVARFERRLDPDGRVIALEVDGDLWTSHDLAREVGECEVRSVPSLTFLIGGSYGLPPSISRAADVRLSLGRITLPHRLARVVLAEQIYRAFTILRNEKYSH